jgi:CDP-diacylglycerol--glycerol-3-phosphate 3-phosphatidyltransferase
MTGDSVAAPNRVFGPGALLTPANAVTIARIALAPVAFVMMLREPDQSSWAICGVWFVLSFSDLLDGRLARKYGSTRSGAFLDPLADKVLVLGGVGIMCWVEPQRFPWVALALIVIREMAVSLFRARYARQGLAVPASQLSKWKTFVQLAAVGWVTLPWTESIHWISLSTLWIGVAIGLISGVQYFIAGATAATAMDS